MPPWGMRLHTPVRRRPSVPAGVNASTPAVRRSAPSAVAVRMPGRWDAPGQAGVGVAAVPLRVGATAGAALAMSPAELPRVAVAGAVALALGLAVGPPAEAAACGLVGVRSGTAADTSPCGPLAMPPLPRTLRHPHQETQPRGLAGGRGGMRGRRGLRRCSALQWSAKRRTRRGSMRCSGSRRQGPRSVAGSRGGGAVAERTYAICRTPSGQHSRPSGPR
mmetsp:Transcript_88802/g.147601  ORF Transcript_88802/g.147601 Transcript_88802/m.147601 type:complete len:220 (+) Transcript_88802:503-1162(+)